MNGQPYTIDKTKPTTTDNQTYRFTLHSTVKFHDGSTLTSADIKASFDRLRNPPQGSNAPLGGWGYSTNEGGQRMPCLMRWPGRIKPGTVCEELATMMDLLHPEYPGGDAAAPHVGPVAHATLRTQYAAFDAMVARDAPSVARR